MKRYKLIIFDLDGTLADTSPGIIECHIYANAAMGRPIRDDRLLDGIIGGPLYETYRERFSYPEEDARRAVEIYRAHYAQVGIAGSRLYPGMDECLASLNRRGYQLAVATLKAENLARRLLKSLGVARYFDVIHGMNGWDSLSKSDIIKMCMAELSIASGETVLVGDSIHDFEGAKQAGAAFLGVTYGFGFTGPRKDMAADCRQLRDRLFGAAHEKNRT